jgi:hypothetical protein
MRGMTILWIALFHFYVDTRGSAGPGVGPHALAAALGRADLAGAVGIAGRALAGIPGCRVDVFLFLSGLVLSLGRPLPAGELYRRRARVVLPDYWLGGLTAFVLLAALAALRATVLGEPFLDQLHAGSRLAGRPYLFEWLDLVRSATVLGRFESARAMQVVAPSLWYVVLVGQLYLLFPLLRAALRLLGPTGFLVAVAAFTASARAVVFLHPILPGFDSHQTVAYLLPFRLLSPAAGMVASRWADRLVRPRGRVAVAILSPAAVGGLLAAAWLARGVDSPRSWALLGGAPTLALSFPSLWLLASASAGIPRLGRILAWAGRNSLAVLVAQDLLRLVVGTLAVMLGDLTPATWPVAPFYLALALALARPWHALSRAARRRLFPARGDGVAR